MEFLELQKKLSLNCNTLRREMYKNVEGMCCSPCNGKIKEAWLQILIIVFPELSCYVLGNELGQTTKCEPSHLIVCFSCAATRFEEQSEKATRFEEKFSR